MTVVKVSTEPLAGELERQYLPADQLTVIGGLGTQGMPEALPLRRRGSSTVKRNASMRTGNHAPPGTSDPGRPAREMLAPQQIRETIVDRPLGRPQIAWQSPDCGSCSLCIDLTLAPQPASRRDGTHKCPIRRVRITQFIARFLVRFSSPPGTPPDS